MKKIILSSLVAMVLMACGDNGISADTEETYIQPQEYSSSISRSSSSVQPSSSSSQIIIWLSSSSRNIIQYSSSSVTPTYSLEEICDMAAANVLNASNITSKTQVCSEYKTYLINVVEMKTNDVNYCMEYETCTTANELPACNMSSYDLGFSQEYLSSLCAKFKAQGYYNFQNCDCTAIVK